MRAPRGQVFGSYAVFPDGKRFLTAERTAEVSTVLRVALGALRQ